MGIYNVEVDNLRFMRDSEENTSNVLNVDDELIKINEFLVSRRLPCEFTNINANLKIEKSKEKNLLKMIGQLEVETDNIGEIYTDPEILKNVVTSHFYNYLNMLFLTFNLSNCGVLSFVRSIIKINEEIVGELTFDSDIFGGGYNLSNEYNWCLLTEIEYEKTYDWLLEVGAGVKQVADSNTLRALFSLSNCAIESGFKYSSIIWISLGIESILELKSENISKSFRDRCFEILGRPPRYVTQIKNKICKFYDMRSRYVHGDIAVDNGMKNYVLDTRIDDISFEIMDMSDLGGMLLVGIIQKMIRENQLRLHFD